MERPRKACSASPRLGSLLCEIRRTGKSASNLLKCRGAPTAIQTQAAAHEVVIGTDKIRDIP